MNKTFKIRLPFHPQDEVRRVVMPAQSSLAALRSQCHKLFSLPDDCVWYFKWVDDEHDAISLTEEHEFHELLQLKHMQPIVHLSIFVSKTQPTRPSMPAHPGQERTHDASRLPMCRARCDNTNAVLRPGEGWYHLPGTTVDLCKAEFDRIDSANRSHFLCVTSPEDLGADLDRYQVRCCPGRHGPGRRSRIPGTCDRKSDKPTVVRGWCDVSNQVLSVGEGWYHRIVTTYDLSDTAFASVPDADKGSFVRVDKPEDLGEEIHCYRIRQAPCDKTAEEEDKTKVAVKELVEAVADIAADFVEVFAENASTEPVPVPVPVLKAEVVSGPSIAAGTSVKRGARLMPVWEVRNSGDVGLWTEVRLRPVGANPLKVPETGFEAPILEAGASGLLSVEIVVPADIPDGPATAEFALTDGSGNLFGPVMRLDVSVGSGSEGSGEREAEAVEMLMDMGLGNALECLRAVRENGGDVNAAAMTLLRGLRK